MLGAEQMDEHFIVLAFDSMLPICFFNFVVQCKQAIAFPVALRKHGRGLEGC
jgi:hypothetical protein